MKSEGGSLSTLAAFFAVTSLLAVGGGNSVIPEMHRYAVDVQHWLTDRQFADSFALAQLTPGPNLIIVTLIGYTLPESPARWWRHWRCAGRPRCWPLPSATPRSASPAPPGMARSAAVSFR